MKNWNHTDIRRAFVYQLQALLENYNKLPKVPRDYQVETIQSMLDWAEDLSGTQRGYIEHPTGLGKTILFSCIVAFAHELRTLIICPNRTLVDQNIREIHSFTGGVLGFLASMSPIRNENNEVIGYKGMGYSDIVITTDESLVSKQREIKKDFNPQIIIFDECHWGYSGSKAHALRNNFPDALIIGLSATPDYLTNIQQTGYKQRKMPNGQNLYVPKGRTALEHFGTCIDKRTIQWGIEQGWLSPLAWGRISFDLSLDHIPIFNGELGPDYNTSKLIQYLNENWSHITQAVIRAYLSGEYDLANRQVFSVCPSVAAAEELAEAINSINIPAASISGKTPQQERRNILKSFDQTEIKHISSVLVLREGWNARGAEICMMLRPSRSYVPYVQTMGRVLRPHKDKLALVLDSYFEKTKQAPLNVPQLFCIPETTITEGEIILQTNMNAPGPSNNIETSYYLQNSLQREFTVEKIVSKQHANKEGILMDEEGNVWGNMKAILERCYRPQGKKFTNYVFEYDALFNNIRTQIGYASNGVTRIFYALEDVNRMLKEGIKRETETAQLYLKKQQEIKDSNILNENEFFDIPLEGWFPHKQRPHVEELIRIIAHYFNIDSETLFNKVITEETVRQRCIAIFIIEQITKFNHQIIGQICGNRLYYVIKELYATANYLRKIDRQFRYDIGEIYRILSGEEKKVVYRPIQIEEETLPAKIILDTICQHFQRERKEFYGRKNSKGDRLSEEKKIYAYIVYWNRKENETLAYAGRLIRKSSSWVSLTSEKLSESIFDKNSCEYREDYYELLCKLYEAYLKYTSTTTT